MAITFHSGQRGVPGFEFKITGSDGVARGTVAPAFVQIDGTGAEVGAGTAARPNVVVGNVASGSTDSDAPVKIGFKYVAAGVTVADGQRVDGQADANGNVRFRIFAVRPGGGDGVANASIVSATGSDSAPTDATLRPFSTAPSVFNGATWDRLRGDTNGLYTQAGTLPAGTDRSGTATTSSTTTIAANAARRGLNIQNIGANNIGVNEFAGTAAIGTAGTYTLTPGSSMNIRTNRAITMIAATGSTAFTATEF